MGNNKHYVDGYNMGLKDRQNGVEKPIYYFDDNGTLVCWEAIYARRVKYEDEKAMANGYMEGYAKELKGPRVQAKLLS
jgi:hypothetical protein